MTLIKIINKYDDTSDSMFIVRFKSYRVLHTDTMYILL